MKLTYKFGAIVALATTALVSQAFASTNFQSTTGDWNDPTNWDNGVPVTGEQTRVGTTQGGGVTPATATLTDHEMAATGELTIGRDNGDVGEVDMSNHSSLSVSSYLQIGYNAGSTGTLIMKNNATLDFDNNNNLNVGNDGTGTLEVHGSAVIGGTNAPDRIRVGFNTGSFGTALIDGGTVNVNDYVSIGGDSSSAGGQGTLRLQNGGTLNVPDVYVWGPNNGPGTRSALRIDATTDLTSITDTINFNGGIFQLDDGAVANTINPIELNNPLGPDNNGMHVLVKDDNTGEIDAELDGVGKLTKDGSGKLILTNTNNAFGGGTFVNEGILEVGMPSTAGGSVFGNGDLNFEGGTVQTTPGMGYTVVVKGDFNADAGTFVVNLGGMAPFTPGTPNSDDWLVLGNANLTTGVSLFAHRLPGSFFVPGDTLQFLTALNVNNTFAQAEGDLIPNDFNTLIQPFAHYVNGPGGEVDAVFNNFKFVTVGKTPNQLSVAAALDRAQAANCIPVAVNVLLNYPIIPVPGTNNPSLAQVYDLIAPEELASIYETGFAQAMAQSINLQRRMDDIRWGSTGFCADGFVVQDNHGYTKNDGKSVADKNPVEQAAPPNYRWGTFVTGTGELTKVGQEDDNARGYQINNASFTMGADYRVSDHFAIGIDGGYTNSRAKLVNDGRLTTDGGNLGLFATYYTGGFYVDGAASGGWNQYDTRRTAFLGQETGSTDGAAFNGMVAAGYDWKRGCWTFGPYADFEYTYVEFNSFTEDDRSLSTSSSLIPLHYGDQNESAYRTNLGFRIAHEQVYKPGEGLNVVPEVRVAWRHEFGDNAYPIESNFVGCDDTFTVHGPWVGSDSAVVDLGLTAYCTQQLSASIFYTGQFGRDNYNNSAITGGLRFAF